MGSDDHHTLRSVDGGRERSGADLPVVIGVAPDLADRVRLAELLDGFGPVGLVFVSTMEEARLLLDRTGDSSGEPPEPRGAHGRVKQLAGLAIDSDLLLASVNGHHIGLTPLEHDLLVSLGSEPRRTWTHAALHEAVWNTRHAGGQADIHSVVKRLRRKLAALGAPTTILAVRGVGFRLEECADDDPVSGNVTQIRI